MVCCVVFCFPSFTNSGRKYLNQGSAWLFKVFSWLCKQGHCFLSALKTDMKSFIETAGVSNLIVLLLCNVSRKTSLL